MTQGQFLMIIFLLSAILGATMTPKGSHYVYLSYNSQLSNIERKLTDIERKLGR